jgi:hypothetical protein
MAVKQMECNSHYTKIMNGGATPILPCTWLNNRAQTKCHSRFFFIAWMCAREHAQQQRCPIWHSALQQKQWHWNMANSFVYRNKVINGRGGGICYNRKCWEELDPPTFLWYDTNGMENKHIELLKAESSLQSVLKIHKQGNFQLSGLGTGCYTEIQHIS